MQYAGLLSYQKLHAFTPPYHHAIASFACKLIRRKCNLQASATVMFIRNCPARHRRSATTKSRWRGRTHGNM